MTSPDVLELISVFQRLEDGLRGVAAEHSKRDGIIQFEIEDQPRLDVQVVLSTNAPPAMTVDHHPFPTFAVRAKTGALLRFLKGQTSGQSTGIETRGDYGLWTEMLRILNAPQQKSRRLLAGHPWLSR